MGSPNEISSPVVVGEEQFEDRSTKVQGTFWNQHLTDFTDPTQLC